MHLDGETAADLEAAGERDLAALRERLREAERGRERAEAAEARFRAVVQSAPAFVAVLEGEGLAFAYANDAYHRLVGRREILGKPLLEALPEVAGQGFFEILTDVRTTGEPYATRERAVVLQPEPGGPYVERFVDLAYHPARDADGTVYGVIAHGIDVTDRVLDREELARREELFRTVFEQAPDDAILVMDEDRVLTAWNPAAERIAGWSAEEAVGRPADVIFTPEDRAAGAPEWETGTAARDGKAEDERWHMRKDGSRFWGSGTMNALHDAAGDVRGFLKVFRDATERARAEAELRASRERLEETVAARTAELQQAVREAEGFNYSIAHDLRTPLRAMAMVSGVLIEELGPGLDERHRDLLERQAHNARRLGTLIDALLRLSRLSRVDVEREGLDVSRVARSAFEELAEQGRSNGCRIEVQEGMGAEGDAGLVRTVLHNLVGNACKFSPGGGTIRVREEGGVFSVSDEGVGFDMAHASRIFAPFERLVSEAEFEGTGIGLANVERIVRRHGGKAWVRSEPGKGTTFYFTLGSGGAAPAASSPS